MKWIQKYTLENEFKKKPDFYTKEYHYDWWAFPMHVPTKWGWQERNYHASISVDEAQTLLKDGEFVANYLSCIELYLQALKEHEWNDYPVRYARMLQSISLFLYAATTKESTVAPAVKKKLLEVAAASMSYAESQGFAERYQEYWLFKDGLEQVSVLLLIAAPSETTTPKASAAM